MGASSGKKSQNNEDPFACFNEKSEEKKIEEENFNHDENSNSYSNSTSNSNGYFYEKNVDKEKIREEADKKFANKKAISCEDYRNL